MTCYDKALLLGRLFLEYGKTDERTGKSCYSKNIGDN